MRPWLVIALFAGSMAASIRHVMGHRHTVLIPVLLVPAVFLGWQEWQFRQDEAQFSAVATDIAGRDVQVECQRFMGALVDATSEAGYVQFDADGAPADTGRIERDTCNDLRDWLHSDKSNPPLKQVIAVHVLAHESYHLAGIRDEAEAECAAMQRDDEVAQDLGATAEQARALATRYAAEVYPQMPDTYRSNDCVDGGTLDADPDDPTWP
ncbi:MAG: hypothetical protein ACJ73L_07930 [Actinomycetes bacterium]